MIDLYSGTPGSGKSLHIASNIYWALKMGRPVLANFYIDCSQIHKRGPKKDKVLPFYEIDNQALNPEMLVNFSQNWFSRHKFHEEAILLVIDECQLLFNAREWSKQGRSDWLSFFTQHRKYGYHVVLIAQFDRMIDRQIRSLIEYEYVHRKVSNFGIKGKALSLVAGGRLFVAVKVWYPMNEKVGAEFFKAKKLYYNLYNSYGLFQAT